MIVPTKHEKLDESLLVLGAQILKFLKTKDYLLEDLYNKVLTKTYISIDKFLDSILTLWLLEMVSIKNDIVRRNDPK